MLENFKLDDYEIHGKWLLPICGGYSLDHFSKATNESTWNGKAVHYILGVIEALPVIGHIVSLFEKCIFSNISLYENLESEIDGHYSYTKKILGFTVYKLEISSRPSQKTLMGSQIMATETRELLPFKEIHCVGAFNVYISQTDEQKLQVEADDNIVEFISTEVENDILYIELIKPSGYSGINTQNVKVYLEANKIDKIVNMGSGNIISTGQWKFDDFEINSSGSGGMTMSLEGDFLKVTMKGSGYCNFTGFVNQQDLSIIGSGDYNANDLVSDTVNIKSLGSGDANLQANVNLTINSSGSGSIFNKGNPAKTMKNGEIVSVRKLT